MSNAPEIKSESFEWISVEEAARIMAGDEISLLDSHKGFLCEGDLPFRPPQTYGTIIIWPPVDIHPGAIIGDYVVIGRYTNICGDITIGERTRIQGFCFIPDSVKIGKRVFIGPNVVFTNIKYPKIRNNLMKQRDGVTVIEDDVSIGAGAVICPGVRIGSRTLIGAGATVTKDIPPDVVVTGTPARIFKHLKGGAYGD